MPPPRPHRGASRNARRHIVKIRMPRSPGGGVGAKGSRAPLWGRWETRNQRLLAKTRSAEKTASQWNGDEDVAVAVKVRKNSLLSMFRRRAGGPDDVVLVRAGQTCVICMEAFKSNEVLQVLLCKHLYHARCINRWLGEHASCCVCKADLEEMARAVPKPTRTRISPVDTRSEAKSDRSDSLRREPGFWLGEEVSAWSPVSTPSAATSAVMGKNSPEYRRLNCTRPSASSTSSGPLPLPSITQLQHREGVRRVSGLTLARYAPPPVLNTSSPAPNTWTPNFNARTPNSFARTPNSTVRMPVSNGRTPNSIARAFHSSARAPVPTARIPNSTHTQAPTPNARVLVPRRRSQVENARLLLDSEEPQVDKMKFPGENVRSPGHAKAPKARPVTPTPKRSHTPAFQPEWYPLNRGRSGTSGSGSSSSGSSSSSRSASSISSSTSDGEGGSNSGRFAHSNHPVGDHALFTSTTSSEEPPSPDTPLQSPRCLPFSSAVRSRPLLELPAPSPRPQISTLCSHGDCASFTSSTSSEDASIPDTPLNSPPFSGAMRFRPLLELPAPSPRPQRSILCGHGDHTPFTSITSSEESPNPSTALLSPRFSPFSGAVQSKPLLELPSVSARPQKSTRCSHVMPRPVPSTPSAAHYQASSDPVLFSSVATLSKPSRVKRFPAWAAATEAIHSRSPPTAHEALTPREWGLTMATAPQPEQASTSMPPEGYVRSWEFPEGKTESSRSPRFSRGITSKPRRHYRELASTSSPLSSRRWKPPEQQILTVTCRSPQSSNGVTTRGWREAGKSVEKERCASESKTDTGYEVGSKIFGDESAFRRIGKPTSRGHELNSRLPAGKLNGWADDKDGKGEDPWSDSCTKSPTSELGSDQMTCSTQWSEMESQYSENSMNSNGGEDANVISSGLIARRRAVPVPVATTSTQYRGPVVVEMKKQSARVTLPSKGAKKESRSVRDGGRRQRGTRSAQLDGLRARSISAPIIWNDQP